VPARPTTLDEVDGLLAAWKRERPDLDTEPLSVLSRVSRLARYLDIARRRAFADVGLETWEFDVLAALRRAGDPYALSPGQLGAQNLVTSGTMTNRVDRLESRGLVRRERDPKDRRGIRVVLTPKGMRTVDSALEDLLSREEAVLAGLDARDRGILADLLRTLVLAFDQSSSARPDVGA
jgi:DNA-binding MarR family transcriptional regulator